jgi:hypothetical protein
MDRVPVLAFAAVVALIGMLAASSVYVTGRNDAAIKAVEIPLGPVGHRR